ncbi:nuclear transport factor 2 family protein [Nonomuraea sp. NPDC050540]|uniref:nuclear transport factor 2 family protein n=1 Tax=Nonomuraea sp. NPDC050540 TaxID=3364367 RepID=UPI00378CCE54
MKKTAMLAGAMLAVGLMSAPAQARTAPSECDSAIGWVSPNACSFIKRQVAFGKEAPDALTRVPLYLDIWDKDATLWEPAAAELPPTKGLAEIERAITGSLTLAPDFRFHGTRIGVDGAAVMFEAANEVTIKGHAISYPAVYRVLMTDDGKVVQGRRYYDRYTWFTKLDPAVRNLFAGVTDSGPAETGRRPAISPDALVARGQAWNRKDAAALLAPLTGAPLKGTGLDGRALRTAQGKLAYLNAFFAQIGELQLKPGQAVRAGNSTYVEWYGTVTPKHGQKMSFGIIERLDDRWGVTTEWQLSFDQLPLIADQAKINALYGLLRP